MRLGYGFVTSPVLLLLLLLLPALLMSNPLNILVEKPSGTSIACLHVVND